MKINKKILIIIVFALVFLLTILFLICKQNYPTEKEIIIFYKEHKESFEIANDYVLNISPEEDNVIRLNAEKLKAKKENMTEEQYNACNDIFSGTIIDGYFRVLEPSRNHMSDGKYVLKKSPKGCTISICKIAKEKQDKNCKSIDGDWCLYYYYPHNE